jgi:hypothetical protein
MTDKFNNVPDDEQTINTFQTEATLGKYDILYQTWFWDGITAESFIFSDEDICDLSDEELKNLVRTSPLVKQHDNLTISRKGTGFAFVNFNFEDHTDDVFTIYKDERTKEEKQQDRERTNQFITDKNNAEVTRIKKMNHKE